MKSKFVRVIIMTVCVMLTIGVASPALASSAKPQEEWAKFPKLSQGTKGGYTRAAQCVIKYYHNSKLANDAVYGKTTSVAVEGYNKSQKLSGGKSVTGATWQSMGTKLRGTYDGYTILRSTGTPTGTKFIKKNTKTGKWYSYRAAPGTKPGTWFMLK